MGRFNSLEFLLGKWSLALIGTMSVFLIILQAIRGFTGN